MTTSIPKTAAVRATVAALCLAALPVAAAPALASGGTTERTASASSYTLTLDVAPASAPAVAGQAAMPSAAPSTGGGGTSFADLPEPVEVIIVVSLSVVAGVMLQRIKRAALGEAQGPGIRR